MTKQSEVVTIEDTITIDGQKCVTTAALAARWKIAEQTLRTWRMRTQGPIWFKFHSRVFYRLKDVLAYEKAYFKKEG